MNVATLHAPYDHLRIHADSDVEKALRVTAVQKEPESVRWLESMTPGEVLLDVGANVGCYSLIAAWLGLRVHAFEPAPFNVIRLRQNLELNDLKVKVYPCALGERIGGCNFDWSSEEPGAASHTMAVDRYLNGGRVPMMTLDFYASLKPDHIKIDVDGAELKVIRGAEKTLPSVKTVQVEIDESLEDHPEVYERLEYAGFKVKEKSPRSVAQVFNVLFSQQA